MRKASQDGGDSTSITSGVENELKKTGAIIKSKRNSIKRKVQSLSHESDDAVIEPLLQKEKTDTTNQSAKNNLLSKTKTDNKNERESDKAKLLGEDKIQHLLESDARKVTDTIIPILSSNALPKYTGAEATLHNHMNINVFHSPDASKGFVTTKSQVIYENYGSKQTGYSPSTLTFTTAKIHTNDKTKHMAPLQVTSVPILSIAEGSKGAPSNNRSESSGVVTSNVSTIYANTPKNNTTVSEKDQKLKTVSLASKQSSIQTPASKIVAEKFFSDINKLTQDIKTVHNNSDITATKNLITESKLTSNNLKDTCIRDNKHVSTEGQKDIDEKPTKISISQPISGSSSGKIKSTSPSVLDNSMKTAATTKPSTVNTNQTIATDKLVQTTKTDKINVSKSSQQEVDFNKNMKSVNSRESSILEGSGNKSNVTSKGKTVNSTSSSIKQLQRQKNAIDKDDTKLTPSATSLSSTASKMVTKSQDIVTSVTSSMIQNKSPVNDVNNITKLPKSTNNITVTSPITSINNKLPSANTTLLTTNKPITSSSFTPLSPIVTCHNTTVPIPKMSAINVTDTAFPALSSSIAKPTTSNVATTRNVTKSTGDILSLKPQVTNTIISKPLISTTSAAKKINASVVEASTSNYSIKPPSISTSTAKTPSVSTSSAKTAPLSTSTAKTPPASKSAAKTPSVSTTTGKTSSISATATKSSPLPVTAAQVTSVSVSTTKASSVFTNIAKDSPLLTNTAKAPMVSKSTTKASVASKTTSQDPIADTTTAKSPPLSASTDKSVVAGKNTTSISKESVKSPVSSSSKLTTETPTSIGSTLKSHKKGEELSNGSKS